MASRCGRFFPSERCPMVALQLKTLQMRWCFSFAMEWFCPCVFVQYLFCVWVCVCVCNSQVLGGRRLERPDDCPMIMFLLMKKCWDKLVLSLGICACACVSCVLLCCDVLCCVVLCCCVVSCVVCVEIYPESSLVRFLPEPDHGQDFLQSTTSSNRFASICCSLLFSLPLLLLFSSPLFWFIFFTLY
eukprot:m.157682 g.157682  ORF g.157682 m.157682 type:complete len:187 (+) comp13350_c0_seq12:2787-3347(+)